MSYKCKYLEMIYFDWNCVSRCVARQFNVIPIGRQIFLTVGGFQR